MLSREKFKKKETQIEKEWKRYVHTCLECLEIINF